MSNQKRGAFEKIFGKFKAKNEVSKYFKMLDGYCPVFSTYDGGVYEMELTRACINAFATHCSKLQPFVEGADVAGLQKILDGKPNLFMTGSQFLYKAATIYEAQNTCYIVPILDENSARERIIGYYPVNPQFTELIDYNGEPWMRYTFNGNQKSALPLRMIGIVSKFLYSNDIRGEDNRALNPTMQLLATQNQGIAEGIKNSASFRFMAVLGQHLKGEDMKKTRDDFVKNNFGPEGNGGLALFPAAFNSVQQIQSTAKIVDNDQMELIQNRVYNYFGTNEDILQNKAYGDTWSAFYEGKIEPFALQLSQAMTAMSYTKQELSTGNAIVWSSNRLQYMSNTDKLQVSSQLFDRGILTTNDIMTIWNLPKVPDGDKRYIRKEYTGIDNLDGGTYSTEGDKNGNTQSI